MTPSTLSAVPAPDTKGTFSHPGRAVRHSYPLAIPNAGFGTAVSLVLKTLPYAGVRFGILLAGSLATLIWYAATFGGMGFLMLRVSPLLGYAWLVAGVGIYGYVWWTLGRYFLYLLKAGHIAVLTELVTRGQIGDRGEGMFAYGRRIVTERFGQANAMFALDLLVHGVVRAFNRGLDWIGGLLPIPGLQSVVGIINAVVYSATTYIDETIFSYSLARGDEDPYRSSRDGLIYYAQNSRSVLKRAIWIVVLDKVASVAVWIVMLTPAFVLTALLPEAWVGVGGLGAFAIAALLAWNVRAAFLEPLFLTMILLEFHVCVRDQPIDLAWDERLSRASRKFVELKDRITGQETSAGVPGASRVAGLGS